MECIKIISNIHNEKDHIDPETGNILFQRKIIYNSNKNFFGKIYIYILNYFE